MKTELLQACDRIITGAVNGLWQGIIIALLVALGLRLFSRTNAATRHAVWLATLLLLAFLIPAHWLRDSIWSPQDKVPAPAKSSADSSSSSSWASESQSSQTHALTLDYVIFEQEPFWRKEGENLQLFSAPVLEVTSRSEAEPGIQLPPQEAEVPDRGIWQTQTIAPTAMGGDERLVSSTGIAKAGPGSGWGPKHLLEPVSWNLVSGTGISRLTGLVLLALWLGTASVRLMLLFWRLVQVRRLKAGAFPADGNLNGLFLDLREELSVKRRVRLKISPTHRPPVVLGFLHPVVLMPADQTRSTALAEAEPILRHELAHVRRRDDWANLVQHLVLAVLFFDPAVWWISRRLALEREIACDDQVLQQGGRARTYALLLADLASRLSNSRPLLAPGVSTSKSQLEKRIDMILDTNRNTSPRLAKTKWGFITSAAALLAALAIYSAPRLVLAQPSSAGSGVNAAPAAGTTVGLVAPVLASSPPSPPQVVPVSETAAPGAPDALNIEPGPKIKSGRAAKRAGQAIIIEGSPDQPEIPPVPPIPAVAPRIVVTPDVVVGIRGHKPPFAVREDSSIEERLERLEKMVQSLIAKQDPKAASRDFSLKADPKGDEAIQQRKQIERLKDAQREAAKAWEKDMSKYAEDVRRAAKEAEKWKLLDNSDLLKNQSSKQLEALRKAREDLEREVEKLNHQIERIEQQQDRLQQERERLKQEQQERSDLTDKPSAEADTASLQETYEEAELSAKTQ